MRIRACTLALSVLAASAPTIAPDATAQGASDAFTDTARQRFQEGVQLFDQGKFEEARAAFLQAYALKKHPAVLLNLAQSELRSDHPVEAARHFAQFLRENSDAKPNEIESAREGLSQARTKTGRIDVQVDVEGADVFIDGELVGRAPLPAPVDVGPGSRRVEARLPGHAPQTADVAVLVGEVASTNFSFETPPTTETPPPPPDDGGETLEFTTATEGRKPFIDWMIEDKVAWATGGATLLGLGMGIGFAVAARSASNSADNVAGQIKVVAKRDPELENYQGYDRTGNPCADPIPITSETNYAPACQQLQNNLDARDQDKTLSTVGFVLAGLGAAGTGVMYFVRTTPKEGAKGASVPKEPPETATVVAPVFGPRIRGLAIGGTF